MYLALSTTVKFYVCFFVQQAIQIRQSPFSGNSSSDSSDIEEPNGLLPSLSCPQDKAPSSNSRRPLSFTKSAANRSVSQEGSCSSLASETSSDYAFPPEDGASVKTDSSDVCLATTAAKPTAAGGLDSHKKVFSLFYFFIFTFIYFAASSCYWPAYT